MKKIALNVLACSMLTFLALGALSPSATPEVYTVESVTSCPDRYGLGLEAPQEAIARFCEVEGLRVSWAAYPGSGGGRGQATGWRAS
jgi:hypothetical protein